MIQRIRKSFRPDALDGTIRVVAVDLGSIDDVSLSDPESQRIGDLHWIARHIETTAQKLLKDPDSTTDLEYRLANVLDEISDRLQADVNNQRIPSTQDYTRVIKDAFQQVASPWRNPLRLANFHDSYNAQTLDAWYVPHLLVDPDGAWVARISTPGPQIITGMRGCGKTMLLRALQFHARATQLDSESVEEVTKRLRDDRFMGLYASSTRLLDRMGEPLERSPDPYPRLYVAYAIEALRAVRHLRELRPGLINPEYVRLIGGVVADYLFGAEHLKDVTADPELERQLLQIDVRLRRGGKYSLAGHPSAAFPHLAEAIRSCSEVWQAAYILFLLDDVSTRYLDSQKIEDLFSSVLFQSPVCAFKLTSEAQTLELALRSPGQIERARSGRDYIVFDLGAEVYEKLTRHGDSGKVFVQDILLQRAAKYANHPKFTPTQILGDTPLETIARRIAAAERSTRQKRQAYFGLTALTRVCVGDIGDVISLYDSILKRGEGKLLPIAPQIQSECYQDFCIRRLYDVNRRDTWLKDIALSFADASHTLLVKSYRDLEKKRVTRPRLRQYSQVYVKIDGGNEQNQYDKIRDLIDAGVFVFAGGSEGPRSKTPDGNPIQQFKMTFRKVFGLSNFIGLAESDRFELDSKVLEAWLADPADGKKILIRNLGKTVNPATEEYVEKTAPEDEEPQPFVQPRLFPERATSFRLSVPPPTDEALQHAARLDARLPRVSSLSLAEVADCGLGGVVLALGFEDRCVHSAGEILRTLRPKRAILIECDLPGRGAEIIDLAVTQGIPYSVVKCSALAAGGIEIPGEVLVDVSGMPKSAIFHVVRSELRHKKVVFVCRTSALTYYPREADVAGAIKAEAKREHHELLRRLEKVSMGEFRPYTVGGLLESDADQSRRRAVCCFASAKYERLLKFLDERSFDSIEIATPNTKTNRSALAKIAAEIAARNFAGAAVTEIDANDIGTVLAFIGSRYQQWYVHGGFNFELAMTGSKPEAIACAAASAVLKVAQCWHVSPQSFDPQRFSVGVGKSAFFRIAMPEAPEI
jgi:hypothetical protein